ncbi:hypothetical protein BLNAU_20889 [Blattamonas nauphoetae]|uniref:Uncharacterized protein n=1 Tax=Blattamonas nauphoetae TaxID=2049346 RepID=A0ABQ9WXD9_9EUKA|nr:hypothetical protein BLNAU_20889 [Blattamonas nauphoetae]
MEETLSTQSTSPAPHVPSSPAPMTQPLPTGLFLFVFSCIDVNVECLVGKRDQCDQRRIVIFFACRITPQSSSSSFCFSLFPNTLPRIPHSLRADCSCIDPARLCYPRCVWPAHRFGSSVTPHYPSADGARELVEMGREGDKYELYWTREDVEGPLLLFLPLCLLPPLFFFLVHFWQPAHPNPVHHSGTRPLHQLVLCSDLFQHVRLVKHEHFVGIDFGNNASQVGESSIVDDLGTRLK